jgi:hypothetical protein
MVRLVLCVEWDPIGVFGHRNTLDEYDDYVDEVIAILRNNPTCTDIANLLYHLEKQKMGLSGGHGSQRVLVAHKLLSARDHFGEHEAIESDA